MAASLPAWLARRLGIRTGGPKPSRLAPPRRLHGLWLQGLDQAPALVRRNFRLWEALNPGWRLDVLDRGRVEALLAGLDLPIDAMTPQALSDVVRVRLVLSHGGVWIDASHRPSRPLDAWLPQACATSGFFAFERPAPDRLITSWFLAASPGHPLIAAWWREVLRFWSRPRRMVEGIPDDPLRSVSADGGAAGDTYPYHWLHYLFELVLVSNPDLRTRFETGEHRAMESCRSLRLALTAGERDPERLRALFEGAPVHKLDWRHDYPLDVLDTLGEVVGPAGV